MTYGVFADVTCLRRRRQAEGEPVHGAMSAKILVVDDDHFTQQLFKGLLHFPDFELAVAETLGEARAKLHVSDFNLVVLDQRLPDGNGLDFFAEMRARCPLRIVILITGHAAVEDAVRAVREGLFDYMTKPFESLGELEAVILKALEVDRAYREIGELRIRINGAVEPSMQGRSPQIA